MPLPYCGDWCGVATWRRAEIGWEVGALDDGGRAAAGKTGPLLVEPRLDAKPWGGRGLARWGLRLPPDVAIGEAAITAADATIGGGATAARSLGEVVAADSSRLGARGRAATGGRPLFPLLIKLIDAADNLSIQVHPDDDGAAPLGRLGKTEAWHVLAAAPGAELYLGLRPGVGIARFRQACRRADGSAVALLRTVPARVGTTVLLPAGVVHALGAGVVVYEVQQPSDLTFRLDDWGRVDAEGRPRALHVEQGLAAARSELLAEPIAPVPLRATTGRRHLLTACRFFALERIALVAGGSAAVGAAESPAVVTLLEGEGDVRSGDASVPLSAGRSAIVWPAAGASWLTARTPAVALRAWVPDLIADVVAQARAAGATEGAIAALGGPLDDVRAMLDG